MSYNTQPLKGTTNSLALKIAPNGDVERLETPGPVELPKTAIWGEEGAREQIQPAVSLGP